MKIQSFINILENNATIKQVETAELKSVVSEYPYFQAARALYLKGLKNQDSFKYNNELKITASHTTDRSVLFDFITSFNKEQNENIHQQINKKITSEKITTSTISSESPKKQPLTVIEDLKIGKPLNFKSTENYSFNKWLELSAQVPIRRKEEKPAHLTNKKEAIIESFIKNNPKIIPLEKGKEVAVPVAENKQDEALMTETLAKVYLEQKKYENAIQAYRILSLKYPEKSGFFADQIKRIQIIQKNKS
ncbi:hypothetical protein [Polaribacter tangerinus]|uniref:hypothetical protein n=1 Tax=Polaribacter tangerinus TaxID=1920034 RepID=UPI000B4AD4F6|nr:hypothetical protein [Polaribacter tangerinus]